MPPSSPLSSRLPKVALPPTQMLVSRVPCPPPLPSGATLATSSERDVTACMMVCTIDTGMSPPSLPRRSGFSAARWGWAWGAAAAGAGFTGAMPWADSMRRL
jgi:hypothetical protein